MNWLCNFVILLAVILAVGPSKAAVLLEQRQKGLLFVHQASCTYDYEVAVHTARGAQSTAGEGFQLHALVSSEVFNRVKLNYVFKDQRIFFYLKACIFLRKNALVLGYFTSISVQRARVDKYYSTACHIARALEEIETVTSCTISSSVHLITLLITMIILSYGISDRKSRQIYFNCAMGLQIKICKFY